MPIEVLVGLMALASSLVGAGIMWGVTRGKLEAMSKDVTRLEESSDELYREKASHADMVERLNKLDADKASKEQVDGNLRRLDERFAHLDQRFDRLEQILQKK